MASPDTGYVTDTAGILGDWSPRIVNAIADLERRSSFEIAVLTVDTLAGKEPQDYAQQVYDLWKVGKKGKDNGLLFLISARDRKLWITTGYGTEKILPDGKVGEIRDRFLRPAFKDGRYSEGIYNGVGAVRDIVLQAAKNGESVATATPGDRRRGGTNWNWFTIGFLLVVIAIAGIWKAAGRQRYGAYRPSRDGFGNDRFGPPPGTGPTPSSDSSDSSSSDSSGFAGDAASGLLDGADSDDAIPLLLLALLIALITAVVGSAFYLVWSAPEILSEAAFQAALASGLITRFKAIESQRWEGSIFGKTALPFVVVLCLSVASGHFAQRWRPGAVKISEIVFAVRNNRTHESPQ